MLGGVLLVAFFWREATSACFKHVSCTSCIAEANDAGSCLWYTQPELSGIGSCVAGRPEYSPTRPGTNQLAVDAYGTWSMVVPFTGERRHFTVPDVDQVSDESCYTTGCVDAGVCDPGYLAVENKPCYSDNVFPEWRTLRCCRQQRNINGYLRGFEAENGTIQGKLFFASCCTVCYPGQVIKGCHAYDPGYCEDCPSGRYNLFTHADSECQPCQPCEAGRVRRRCGPSTQGICELCEAGKEYKVKGLEGSYTDTCLPCESCPSGHMRVGCGGDNPGYCAPCQGSSFFSSPICRNCPACTFPVDYVRHGCGGQQLGICVDCPKGRFEDVSLACLTCPSCSETETVDPIDGMELHGAWARVGCGGKTNGKCVRMASRLDLEGLPRCPSSVDPDALCEGTQIAARWSVQGLSLRELDAEYGNCTVDAGLCLSGFFRVKLLQRQVDAFDGVEVADLGDYFAAELEHLSSLDATPAVMAKGGLQLPSGLPEASGYFLRVFFYDAAGSCCSAVSTSPLFADSEDFSLDGEETVVQEALDRASEEISSGQWEDAFALMSSTCASSNAASTWFTCETAKALQLGLPVGQRALVPLPLLHSANSAEVAALGAAYSVTEAGQRLVDIELIYTGVVDLIPANASVWRALMYPLFGAAPFAAGLNTTTSTTVIPFTVQEAKQRLEELKQGAMDLSQKAELLHQQWASELSSGARLLPQKLQNLQEIDHLSGASTANASFDVIRMAQGVTWKVSYELEELKKSSQTLQAKADAMAKLLQRIGSMALLLVGTWGHTWYHGLEWRLKCQWREGDELHWPPILPTATLGGAYPPPGAIEVSESKKRIWMRFQEVAEECFSYAELLLSELAQETTTSQPSRRLSFSTKSLDRVLPTVRHLLLEVVGFTEQVIEPLAREDALLFAGALPNISYPGTRSCSVRGWCLSFATEFLEREVILDDVMDGFGVSAVRPWVDPRIEELRLRDGAAEVLDLAWGRLRILEELLLQLVDLRQIQPLPSRAHAISVASEALAEHLSRLILWAEAPQNVTIVSDQPESLWHWQELSKLRSALDAARRSASLLARRRLGRIEALAAWVAQQRDDGYFLGPAGWSWRQPWSPWSTRDAGSGSGSFFMANLAAKNKLQSAIDEAEMLAVTSGAQAYMRIDLTATSHPVTYAGLKKSGSTVFRLQVPKNKAHLMMHSEAKVFLMSPSELVTPLSVGEETGEAPSGAVVEPHVELRLKRLIGAFDVTQTAVEPTMESSVPFVTRHQRRSCDASLGELFVEKHPEIVHGALLPVEGFWILTARDGTTARFLNLDSGTTIRLLFEINVPSTSSPPWHLLEGVTDVLYKLPEDGVCANLQPIFGQMPATSTFPPTTRTTLYTTTATTIALIPTTTHNNIVVVPDGGGIHVEGPRWSTTAPPAAAVKPWTPPVWFWFSLILVPLLCCGVGVRIWVKRRRRKREVLPDVEEGKAAPTILEQESRDGALRGAADAKTEANPYLAMAKKAKKQASRKGSSWEVADTPRDKDDDAWSEASTPEGSESGGSSDGDSDGTPSPVSPRTVLAQKALQQHMQQFTPERIAADALKAHAKQLAEESEMEAAAAALGQHARRFEESDELEAERGGSKTSKATAMFGQKQRPVSKSSELEEGTDARRSTERVNSKESKQSSKHSKQSKQSKSSRAEEQ